MRHSIVAVAAILLPLALGYDSNHQFQTFDNGALSPMGNLESLVKSLQKEVTDIRKEVHTRMDTMKYELTCEIRNMKEALSKEREEMSAKVDHVALEMTDFKKKLKRGLRRVGTQNDDIKGELRSQKAELFAVRNSVYDAREEVLDKGNLILRKVNATNGTLVCHLSDLRTKLYKINNNLAFISDEHKKMMDVMTHRFGQPKKYSSEDYNDRLLPGCTYTPLDTHELGLDALNKSFVNETLPKGVSGLDADRPDRPTSPSEDLMPPEVTLLPTMPEDCNDDKRKYLEYPPMPRDCKDVFDLGFMENGVYRIQPPGLSSREVYCDHHTAGGGWTVMVARRKQPRHISFNRSWHEYEVGFGDPSKEYWIGLKGLHALTSGRPHQLRGDMEDWEGNTAWAAYTFFAVSGEEDKYRLRIAGYTGTAGDSMRHSHHQMFSTVDQDNDQENSGGDGVSPAGGSCARGRGGGGWWWGRCACTQPTGQYRRGRYQGPERGITWWHWKDSNYSLKTLLLKIRPLE
ncbi:angiopoietin-related protein 1-like isoform X1 [Homarus americanus]|uniref:angiopoietin-related protein 1-like isoform X1 n=1 Tax=Homarus americanus TaxID=6706 RepID=UPI001C47969D|nr:angiopoietin-related protein 1-like isoform X1 [Homarus americanus]XP_042204795.1 angiopoietin-related protein 1-like isoform X1 [Homarus americanus]XP_042204796.1 angiopoietin-related protein 1-like isoform X1 [Homarus americanus]XP_042204797.1 angiopoietin-related protein 1-like isoform X1 [Homarus americanus]